MTGGFASRPVRALGKTVFRLGLASSYGIDEGGFEAAIDRGVNYIFWTPRSKKVTPALKRALKRDRERFVLATGPSLGFFAGGVRMGAERLLRLLGTEYLDVFQLFWLGVGSALTGSTVRELEALKREGKVRALGASIHDRVRAGKLAEASALDMLMLRYNAAHPGAEQDVFPHLSRRQPAVVAYTATSWRKLLKRPSGWKGPLMTASDCYRFCLSNPNVDVVLTGPRTRAELEENLNGLQKGPLSADEDRWMREFGRAVHG